MIITLTRLKAMGAYRALRPLSNERFPGPTALKVRGLHRALGPVVDELAMRERHILEEFGGRVQQGSTEIASWRDPQGAQALHALHEEPVVLAIQPILFSEFALDDVRLMPSVLVQLEDAGLLVEEEVHEP